MSDSFFLTARCNCFYCGNVLGFDHNEIKPLDPCWICVTASKMSWSPLAARGRTFRDNHRVGDALPFYFELDLRCKCRWKDHLHFLGLKFPLHLKVSRRSRNIWAYNHSYSFHMYSCSHSTCWEWMSPAYFPLLQVIGPEPGSSQTARRGRLNTKVWSVTDLEKKCLKGLV